MKMPYNFVGDADWYKDSQPMQYPPNMGNGYSYIEARGGESPHVLFFGQQIKLKDWQGPIIKQEDIDEVEAENRQAGMPFDKAAWTKMFHMHGGNIPIRVKSLDEGTLAPISCALTTIESIDKEFGWLGQQLETQFVRANWYPNSIATKSFNVRLVLERALKQTADNPRGKSSFMLHDFGARGVSSYESSGIGGCAHLTCFRGTDTKVANRVARFYYDEQLAGFSIPASEHSTTTSWGRDGEHAAFRRQMDLFSKPGSKFGSVCDSYDLMNAITHIWGEDLKHDLIASGGTLVARPDSGNPYTVPIAVIDSLTKSFGYELNSKQFRVLADCVRAIQGDGLKTVDDFIAIIRNMIEATLSIENLSFGMGSGLLQEVTRDDHQYAQKMSAAERDDKWIDVYKQPKTDPRKNSKRGRLAVVSNPETVPWDLRTIRLEDLESPEHNLLQTRFECGELFNTTNFQQVRDRVDASIERLIGGW